MMMDRLEGRNSAAKNQIKNKGIYWLLLEVNILPLKRELLLDMIWWQKFMPGLSKLEGASNGS